MSTALMVIGTLFALTCVPALTGIIWVIWPAWTHRGKHRS